MNRRRRHVLRVVFSPSIMSLLAIGMLACPVSADDMWTRHVIHEGEATYVAIAADFTGDGRPDVISHSGGKTRLFVAPEWSEHIIDETPGYGFIHGETFDVDGDGDPDFIGARYMPGLIVWLERPDDPTAGPWTARIVDDQLNGIHGVLIGDVDQDGKLDLLANSAQPAGPHPNSAAWLKVPPEPRRAERWMRFIFADQDAPGLSHYLGFGDVNGDGRPDIALAAKGGEEDPLGLGEWFAWWEAPNDPRLPFKKHRLPGRHPGATNIQQADLNGDGKVDFLASCGHGRGLVWFESPSWEVHEINTDLLAPHCLQVVDLDGDGDIDAATCAYESEVVAWFENDGRGGFTTHVIGQNQAAYDIRAIDMDGDGDLDLLIAGQNSNNVVWYENPHSSPVRSKAN
ncbi:MAG: VCBS repeat-containing protein [Planctomycetaceae bacterium]|nr:VCBS repeat-containing protein [Planctomycetaceae bacterium]